MQLFILGILILALAVQAIYLKNQFNQSSFKSFDEPYKYRLAKLPLFVVYGMFALGLIVAIYGFIGNSDSGNNINTESSNSVQELNKSSTPTNAEVDYCVVCGNKCESVYHENIHMGHHVAIDGIKSGVIVCGLDCEIKLRKKNEAILNNEYRRRNDPNSQTDPDIKMPDFNN